jgi:hypothetical protein
VAAETAETRILQNRRNDCTDEGDHDWEGKRSSVRILQDAHLVSKLASPCIHPSQPHTMMEEQEAKLASPGAQSKDHSIASDVGEHTLGQTDGDMEVADDMRGSCNSDHYESQLLGVSLSLGRRDEQVIFADEEVREEMDVAAIKILDDSCNREKEDEVYTDFSSISVHLSAAAASVLDCCSGIM